AGSYELERRRRRPQARSHPRSRLQPDQGLRSAALSGPGLSRQRVRFAPKLSRNTSAPESTCNSEATDHNFAKSAARAGHERWSKLRARKKRAKGGKHAFPKTSEDATKGGYFCRAASSCPPTIRRRFALSSAKSCRAGCLTTTSSAYTISIPRAWARSPHSLSPPDNSSASKGPTASRVARVVKRLAVTLK